MKPILVLILFTFQIFAQVQPDDVKSFILKNGMKFYVLEDNSIPNANMYLFFKVGSRNEYIGITGISHFFEHMMFNGAKKYGPKQFDRVMEANGGSNNAYTTENITVYTDWFPKQSLEVIFDLESDRIANLNFDPKMIESERGVILSERSTGLENNPLEQLWQELQATAFVSHPYMWPVIGWESDIKNWTKEDLENYFHTYYAPNNCVAVISGDVKFNEVKKLAEKYFEPIPAGPKPREVHTIEPEQTGERRLFVKREVPSPYLMIAYHVPQTGSEEYYAIELLNSILSEGASSRLYQSIVEQKQLAIEVGTYYPNAFDPTLFYFYGICNDGVRESQLEKAILEEVDKVINEGVSEAELQKVKNQKLMQFYRTTETINGISNTIGTYELFFGDYKKLFTAPDDYKKVTVSDIQKVAAKYFTKQNRTVGILNTEEEQ
ncbi:Putative Zn-dependent peptidase [Ignavibacterium album JCM 16511]|uniref:Putative Zn-dependent peptidase n=1 Tax=Ignavibacterium album (strain DSM 19864 / JCM 16511 / NBRC 101810 / Mat9-16) TaxID=945713 RepID=I0AG48_IGNAJ|nr:pitrilysin family protein [Ignavibacterium album]AFH47955.1 Putative Zn-dependent peptidase [Ignavibacterium album JCM 16511]